MRFMWLLICLVLMACSGQTETPMPDRDPSKSVGRELRGNKFHRYAAKDNNDQFLWAQQILANYLEVNDDDMPGQISELKQSCDFPAPTSNDEVHHVHIAQAMQTTPIYTVSAKTISNRAERFVEAYVRTEGKVRSSFSGSDALGVVNVVVTETNSPVYLVLTSQSAMLWNIQAAPTVEISNIALIGAGTVGIANAPPDSQITAIGGKKIRGCSLFPARKPKDHWSFVQNVKGHSSGQDHLEKNYEAAKKYSRWFGRQFNTSPASNQVEAFGLSNVLIGEPPQSPEARPVFISIKDADVKLTKEDYTFTASKSGYKKQNLRLIHETARQAVGGDLKSLLIEGAT